MQPATMGNINDMYSLNSNFMPRKDLPRLIPYRPYLYSTQPSITDHSILMTLHHHFPLKDITDMALEFGEDNTIAIAQVAANLRLYGGAAMGAATSIYSKHMQEFVTAIKRYQNALLEYRNAVKSNPAGAAAAKQKAISVFQTIQRSFHNEINAITTNIRARRGTPLTSSTRAINIARSSRKVAKLSVADQVQASRLVKFCKYGRFLGNGLAVIDLGSRVADIQNTYRTGGNWEREMFTESMSLGASATAAGIIVGAGTEIAEVALACFLGATPAGWVLVVVGLGVAGVAAGVSVGLDHLIKNKGKAWYDDIMKWLGKAL